MNEQLKKDHRGSLFPNDRKTKPTHPDFTGKIVIEGKEWRIAAWENKTAEGKTYLSLITSPPLPADAGAGSNPAGTHGNTAPAQNTGNNSNKPAAAETRNDEHNGLSDDLDDLEAILKSSDDDNPFN